AGGEEHSADQGGNEPAGDSQADFINEPTEVNLSDILKHLVEPEVQSMVDVPIKQAKPEMCHCA
ncbi:hypothetical protein Tco_1387237, partial [Tanacetum coccineum]